MLCNDSNKEQIVAFCDDRGQTVFANKITENSKITNCQKRSKSNHENQGGLNKKEIQLNPCNIFLFSCLMNSIFCVKLGRAVTFMKCLASVVSLIFLAKTLIWNKIRFLVSNLLNFPELVENEPLKSVYKKHLTIFLFLFDLSLLNVKISRAYN